MSNTYNFTAARQELAICSYTIDPWEQSKCDMNRYVGTLWCFFVAGVCIYTVFRIGKLIKRLSKPRFVMAPNVTQNFDAIRIGRFIALTLKEQQKVQLLKDKSNSVLLSAGFHICMGIDELLGVGYLYADSVELAVFAVVSDVKYDCKP